MKELKVISVLVLLIISCLAMKVKSSENSLKIGDISFTAMNSSHSDGFSIYTYVDILPKSQIRFTDSEWNGNNFEFDENDILWETGNDTIYANSVIQFTDLNSKPIVSMGAINGSMKISKKKDAIFAYTGNERMPSKFLAACANDELGYGTLINTNLIKGTTAMLFQ